MWTFLTRLILRNRLAILIIIGLITLFMGYEGLKVKMSYEMARMLPSTDSTIITYEKFLKQFGQDGSVMFVGIQDENLFTLDHFGKWYDLTESVRNIEGVEEALSITRTFQLKRNDSIKKFDFVPLVYQKPQTQAEVDSIKKQVDQLVFYEGLLFNSETNVSMMMITLDKEVLNTKSRVGLIHEIEDVLNNYSETNDIQLYISGMPYIRTITSETLQNEVVLFVFLAIFVVGVILFIFFRSFKTVLFIVSIVLISVIFMFGTMQLLGFKITMLTAVLPPLLIVIGVENSIFLLNKYYNEYYLHKNKIKALSRVIRRIGSANLLTNVTTAVGFAAFIITGNSVLVEFGILASINILAAYLFSLFLIPIIFSYLGEPKPKQYTHFEKGKINSLLSKITWIVYKRRNVIYILTAMFIVLGIIGVTRLHTTGKVVDDISKRSRLYTDLIFFEKHFKGIMPLEISIDTKKKNGILRLSTLKKIEQLQDSLAVYPQFSSPLSIAQVAKFAKQAFYHGDKKYFEMPSSQEFQFIMPYMPEMKGKGPSIINSFIDTNMQITRVSVQMANVSTPEIDSIQKSLKPKVKQIFPSNKYDVTLTGSSIVFLEGTNYMIKNLLSSLILALIVIAILMALTFTSFKMVVISLIPNLIPQLLCAALMGYTGISIKISTILIFSIALGISVDNTIHFLSRYRLQLRLNNWKIKESVIAALHETGFSMIYSSIVLFFGFSIFVLSSLSGTQALGYLVSFTLLIAVLSNLFVLPSLLLTLDKKITTKGFKDPIIDVNVEFEDDTESEKIISESIHEK